MERLLHKEGADVTNPWPPQTLARWIGILVLISLGSDWRLRPRAAEKARVSGSDSESPFNPINGREIEAGCQGGGRTAWPLPGPDFLCIFMCGG
jgi:hypothetical protein